MPQLLWLNLDNTKITDAGLPHLRALSQLGFLHLGRTAISDDGLDNLFGLKNLKTLHVTRTKVSETGGQKLREALPGCEVITQVQEST
jgi:hypothetical protein